MDQSNQPSNQDADSGDELQFADEADQSWARPKEVPARVSKPVTDSDLELDDQDIRKAPMVLEAASRPVAPAPHVHHATVVCPMCSAKQQVRTLTPVEAEAAKASRGPQRRESFASMRGATMAWICIVSACVLLLMRTGIFFIDIFGTLSIGMFLITVICGMRAMIQFEDHGKYMPLVAGAGFGFALTVLIYAWT